MTTRIDEPVRMAESRRLRGKLELVLPLVLATGRRLMSHPHARAIYPEFLILTHHIIRASVPLMETALAITRTHLEDRVSVLLSDYFEEHIPEELGHDGWLLEDLESIGYPRDEVLARNPSPAIVSLVGSQYYWIQHVDPVALLGYITLFEGYPVLSDDIDRLRVATGYGPSAFRTLVEHAELDTGHGQELDRLLDALPLTERQQTLIGINAIESVRLATIARLELLDRF